MKVFNLSINRLDGLIYNQFQGLHMENFPVVEDHLTLSFLLFDVSNVDGSIVIELVRRYVQETAIPCYQLPLSYNSHIWYGSNIIVVSTFFCCPHFDTCFYRTFNLERHLSGCSERARNVYPVNVLHIRETVR